MISAALMIDKPSRIVNIMAVPIGLYARKISMRVSTTNQIQIEVNSLLEPAKCSSACASPCAVILGVLSQRIRSAFEADAAYPLLGMRRLCTLAAGCYSYWDDMSGVLRFVSLLVVLAILVAFGLLKFRAPPGASPAPARA